MEDVKENIFCVFKNNELVFKINKNDKNFNYFFNKLKDFLSYYGFLFRLHLNLNYSCNQNCIHCCNPKDMNSYSINFEQAKKIIDEASDLGAFDVTLTGGECTINKDFIKIAKYIKKILVNLCNFYFFIVWEDYRR